MTEIKKKSHIKIVVIFVITSSCLMINYLALSKLIESEQIRFENLSQKLQNEIKNELESNTRVLAMVKFGISQNPDFNRSDFNLLTQVHLSYMNSLQAIQWIPKVSKDEKSIFEETAQQDGFPEFKIRDHLSYTDDKTHDLYPIYFLEPYVKNELTLGLNLASIPDMMQTMFRSAQTGKTLVVSEWNISDISPRDHHEFTLFTPVYHRNQHGYEPPGVHRIKGFLSTVHKTDRLIKQAISRTDTTGLNLLLTELNQSNHSKTLYKVQSDAIPTWIKFESNELMKVGSRDWELKIIANNRFWSETNWTETILLIMFGCLFVTSAGVLMIYLLNDAARTKKLVEIRTRNYKRAKQQAELALESRSLFLANMSHEIRTPLNSIIGYTELLAEDETHPEKKNQLEMIKESGEGLLCIINDILDLSKLESGKLTFNETLIPLKSFLEHTVNMYQDLAKRKHNTLELFLAEDLKENYLGDPNRLRQILINLIGNAIKFTSSGQVRLSVSGHAQGVSFEISDTGIGIDSESLPKIFDHFTQADNSGRTQFGGTGLGLAIVKMLVSQWNGSISVRSEPEKGTTFSLIIPLTPTEDKPVQVPKEAHPLHAALDPTKALSVLVCEDNQMNIQLVRTRLTKSGFKVDIAENGQIGFEKFITGSYDFILMDIRMPVMDGVTATLKIRSYEKEHQLDPIPIIAQTANVMKEDIQTYLAAGMNTHIAKPIIFKKLCQAIENMKKAG